MNKFYFFLALLASIAIPRLALGHGASIEYRETTAITVQAKYDDGKPMANAQVVVYAPSDRATPWLKGTTDESGEFTFVPDLQSENTGNWDVKIRQSGHGNLTSIPLHDGKLATDPVIKLSSTSNGYSSSQKLIMAAAVGWGFVGTALFFSRSKSSK